MLFINVLALLLPVFCHCQDENLLLATWREVFTVDVLAPGASLPTAADNELDCVRHCLQMEDCKTSAFHHHSATCWLYRHLVEYITSGMASPDTRYFWRLSSSCPEELGYKRDAGICFKIYYSAVNWTVAEATCREDDGHLLIADTPEKVQAVMDRVSVRTWLGASDEDKEGDWRWVDGSLVHSQNWYGNNPNNAGNREHFLELIPQRGFNDIAVDAVKVVACEVPFM